MAKKEHLEFLEKGVEVWNDWRKENPYLKPDLSGTELFGYELAGINFSYSDLRSINLSNANLFKANLSDANLSKAKLTGAKIIQANLMRADFSQANLMGANLDKSTLTKTKFERANLAHTILSETDIRWADLTWANLLGANLVKANLSKANLTGAFLIQANLDDAKLISTLLNRANLSGSSFKRANLAYAELIQANLIETKFIEANLNDANLRAAIMVQTDFEKSNLSDSRIFGISAWRLNLKGTNQTNLIISDVDEPEISVDNLEVAQFVYLLLHNEKIREVINTVANKAVLILGRFTPERKIILDTIRQELRKYGYLPILFDFDKPSDRDFTETIMTLAGLSKFVIADISEPKSSPLESQAIIPNFMIPFVPIIQEDENPFSMLTDLQNKHDWVLATVSYKDKDELIKYFKERILKRAEEKFQEIKIRKLKEMQPPIPISEFR